jgi:hypothetical protein
MKKPSAFSQGQQQVFLQELRLDPKDEEELVWYYHHSASEVGLSSSFGAILDGTGPSTSHDHAGDGRANAAEKQGRIKRQIESVRWEHQETIRLVFGWELYLPRKYQAPWSRLTPLGALIYHSADPAKIDSIVTQAGCGKGVRKERAEKQLMKILLKAETKLVAAISAYQRAKKVLHQTAPIDTDDDSYV